MCKHANVISVNESDDDDDSERPYQISCMGHRNITPRCCFCRVGYICAATDCISADTKRRAVPLRQPSLLCTCSAAVLSSAAVEITCTVSHLYTFLVHVTAHLPPPGTSAPGRIRV